MEEKIEEILYMKRISSEWSSSVSEKQLSFVTFLILFFIFYESPDARYPTLSAARIFPIPPGGVFRNGGSKLAEFPWCISLSARSQVTIVITDSLKRGERWCYIYENCIRGKENESETRKRNAKIIRIQRRRQEQTCRSGSLFLLLCLYI